MEGYPMPIDEPFKLRLRDPLNIELSVVSDAGTVDLFGFGTVWNSQLRWSDQVETVAATWTIDISSGVVGGKLTYVVLSLTTDQTSALTAGHQYVFDVEAKAAGVPFGVWRGYVQTESAVTRV